MLVEGRGRAALAARRATATTSSLGRALDADVVVLVAPAGLGHDQRGAARAPTPFRAGDAAARRLVVALNRYDADDDLHRRNHGWLAGDGFHLVTDPGRARRGAAPRAPDPGHGSRSHEPGQNSGIRNTAPP